MQRLFWRVCFGLLLTGCLAANAFAQKALTWQEIRNKFEMANPSLRAAQLGVDESRAAEITAYLRPNPALGLTADQIDPFTTGPLRPFQNLLSVGSLSYLHERQHKRELRRESAQKATAIAVSGQADLERNLLFSLRTAFVQTLQAKAVRDIAKENLYYYDHVLAVNRDRYKAGDLAQVDLDRLELLRVQFESDLQTAEVNLRTAKIQLLTLLNDRTPVEQFDVTGPFDFTNQIAPLDDFRRTALDARPDLKAAVQSIDKSISDHQLAIANGSTDPTFGFDAGRNPPIEHYIGFSMSIPLRIFDRNQGEKLRTKLDIERNENLMQAARAQVFNDVDSAYATLMSTVILLQPYKDRYLQQAVRIRDTVSFAYQHGGASLLDFLDTQKAYRDVQLNYLNLVGSHLTAASQLNLAVGREVIQ